MKFELQGETYEVRKKEKFIEFWCDEYGPRGEFRNEPALFKADEFFCWVSDIEGFISSPMAKLVDVETLKKVVILCK